MPDKQRGAQLQRGTGISPGLRLPPGKAVRLFGDGDLGAHAHRIGAIETALNENGLKNPSGLIEWTGQVSLTTRITRAPAHGTPYPLSRIESIFLTISSRTACSATVAAAAPEISSDPVSSRHQPVLCRTTAVHVTPEASST